MKMNNASSYNVACFSYIDMKSEIDHFVISRYE